MPFLAAEQLLAGLPELVDDPHDAHSTPVWGATASHLVRAVDRVAGAAGRAPVVLVLDDLQWADEATAGLVQHLAFHAGTAEGPLRLLLVVAVRAGDAHDVVSPGVRAGQRLQREPMARTMHVGPLDEVDAGELCHAITGHYPLNASLREILASTGGSPLLVRALLEARVGDAGWHRQSTTDAALDLLEGRMAGLGSGSRRAVQTMAVVGQRTPDSVLVGLLGQGCERHIGPLVERGLVTADGDGVAFEHSLYRHAVLHSIDPQRLAQLEREVVAVLASPAMAGAMPVAAVAAHLRREPGRHARNGRGRRALACRRRGIRRGRLGQRGRSPARRAAHPRRNARWRRGTMAPRR